MRWKNFLSAESLANWDVVDEQGQVRLPGVGKHEFTDGNRCPLQRLLGRELFFEVRLQGCVVHPFQHGEHDEEGEKQRQADQDLIGRGLRGTQRLAQDRQYDHDAGERCHQDQRRRQQAQQIAFTLRRGAYQRGER